MPETIAFAVYPGDLPPAEEKNGENGGKQYHLHVFGKKEHGELEARILQKIACDDFAFSFRQVKGDLLDLGHAASQEKQKSGELCEDAPQGDDPPQESSLLLHDGVEGKASVDHED